MTSQPSEKEILTEIRGILITALRKPAEQVQPGATLFGDLGAESLDLLDIRFRMEKVFGIRIAQDEISKTVDATLSTDEVRRILSVEHLVEFVSYRLHNRVQG